MRNWDYVLRRKGGKRWLLQPCLMFIKVISLTLSSLLTLYFVLSISNISPVNKETFRYKNKVEKRKHV